MFAPRAKEADSREFQDGAAVVKTAVDELWKTVSKKDRVLFSVKQVLKKFPQGLTLSNALSKVRAIKTKIPRSGHSETSFAKLVHLMETAVVHNENDIGRGCNQPYRHDWKLGHGIVERMHDLG